MRTALRPLILCGLAALAAAPARQAASQATPSAPSAALRTSVFTTKREIAGELWGEGNWLVFGVDEDARDLNGDRDVEDTVFSILNLQNLAVTDTGLAFDTASADESDDRVVALHPKGTWVAFSVSEAAQGKRDLNGNGAAADHVVTLVNPATRQVVSTGVAGKDPAFAGELLLFVQPEAAARKDLNGDGDAGDEVLCSYDPATKQVESLGMEAAQGFEAAGDWVVALTAEAAQGARDLNGDRDLADAVLQLYQVSQKKWTNTGLDGSGDYSLSSKLLAIGVEEANQGARDLNADGDAQDIVVHVWDLAQGKAQNLAMDGGEGIYADGDLVAFAATEASQGNKDLNGDGDPEDAVAHVFRLGSERPVNLARDCTGGLAVARGKVAFASSEEDNGKKDLNRDGDTDDYVLMVYDPVKNNVVNSLQAVDGDLITGANYLAWKVLEADQGNKDLNRDRDTDDSILFVMDLNTGAFTPTGYASGDTLVAGASGIAFTCFEADQGERDLNMDMDAEDEILMVARIVR